MRNTILKMKWLVCITIFARFKMICQCDCKIVTCVIISLLSQWLNLLAVAIKTPKSVEFETKSNKTMLYLLNRFKSTSDKQHIMGMLTKIRRKKPRLMLKIFNVEFTANYHNSLRKWVTSNIWTDPFFWRHTK